jgi:uncharacterized coiled-coil protein SlyX
MELKDYPRPADDNGWGFHSSSGAYEQPWMSQAWREKFVGVTEISGLSLPEKRKIMREYAGMLHEEYGIRWFKLLAASDSQIHFARALVDAGIETIVRMYAHEPHPTFTADSDLVRRYVDVGVHYFEWGNEPNLYVEWDEDHWDQGHRARQVATQLRRNFDKIREGGGIPLFPAMSPGGHIDARQMLRDILEELKNKGALGDLEGAAVAIHNRPHNIPASVPPSDELTVAFREYEWIDDLIRSYLGHPLPLMGTEGGYEIGDNTHADYPPITGETHATYNMEIFRGFKDQWRPSLFCVCMWLVELYEKGNYSFANAAWWYNKISGGEYEDSILPAVHALHKEPKFVRAMPWEGQPLPPAEDLSLTVTWPPDGAHLSADLIEVWGQAKPKGSTAHLQVNGGDPLSAVVDASGEYAFSNVQLVAGSNRLELWVTSADGRKTSEHVVVDIEVTDSGNGGNGGNSGELLARLAEVEARLDDLESRGEVASATLSDIRSQIETLSSRMTAVAEHLRAMADALPE